MSIDPRLYSLPFDHFERYQITSEVLSILVPEKRSLRILDVGGHSSSLKHMRPADRIILADPKEAPPFTHIEVLPFRHDAYVRALGGRLPFPDAAFDVVTAHDTLEHVPPDGRSDFLNDLVRVGRRFLIINGPVATDRAVEGEQRLSRFWKTALAWNHHPLEEHLEYGLPVPEVIEGFLRDRQMAYVAIPNGNIDIWLVMMTLEAYGLALPEPIGFQFAIDRSFNRAFAPRDYGGTCYRTAFVVALNEIEGESLSRVANAFRERLSLAAPIEDATVVEGFISLMEEHGRAVRAHLQSLVGTVQRAESEKVSREASITSLGDALARSEARLDRAENELRVRLAELTERRAQAEDLRREANTSRDELARIRGSAGYRLAAGSSRRIRRWFPRGTLRGSMLGRMRQAAYRRLEHRSVEIQRTERGSGEPETPFVTGVAASTPAVYQRWIDRFEPSEAELEAQRSEVRGLSYRPLISIVVPVWNAKPGHLNHALESVLEQTYDRVELCVADGASKLETKRVLSRFRRRDDRVRVRFLDENRGISGNTMEALAMADGEFVGFLDQTDVLAPDALAQVVQALNRDPGLDVIYSDWDLLSDDGKARLNPFFTPQWSPELLLSSNYMTHLSVIRRRLVEEVGGLRSELDGAQDWDLLLRVMERTDRVARIPAVLYHWRADPSSAVLSLDSKPRAEAAQRRAVSEHLERRGSPAEVTRTAEGRIRIKWPLNSRPTVSIIIPTLHNRELLERCLAGIERSAYPEREVLVIETAGRTEEREGWYRDLGRRHPFRVLWWEAPFNYSTVNNFGAREANGDVLVFLNDDTEPLTKDWLDEIVGWLQQDGIGAVGGQLLAEDGSIQHAGVILKLGGFAEHLFRDLEPGGWTLLGSPDWYRNVSAVTGACLAVTRSTLNRVGGWNEGFQLCGGDVELGLRLRRHGLRVIVDPFVRVRHVERATRGTAIPQSDFGLSFWHYQRYLYGADPYFNPNLSEAATIPALREDRDPSSLDVVSEVLGRDVRPRAPSQDADETKGLIAACRVSAADLESIGRSHAGLHGRREVGSLTWFIPDFENPYYGGIHSIFRFADQLARVHGVKNRFAVIGTGPEEYIRSGLQATFPDIADSDIFVAPGGSDADLDRVPHSDAAICTLWVTAYPMARWRGADRLFSFVQDFEPMFYPAGPLYALAEQTYRMGLYGIANTPPLKEIYESYGQRAVAFTPCIDTDIFHHRRPPRAPDEPLTVFMYGRPGHPRNSYELALAALGKVKRSMGERVHVVSAGSWSGVGDEEPWLDRLGLLDYRETADLYRRCDAGLVLSVSKHPTYIPLQLMACGALVVANENPANSWLLRHRTNALLADPTVDALASVVEEGLEDREQRERLTAQASRDIEARHSNWGPEIDRVYEFICDPTTD